jgi:hypothetical protein
VKDRSFFDRQCCRDRFAADRGDAINSKATCAEARHVVVCCSDHVDVHRARRDDLRDLRLICADATARSSSELSAHCGFRPTGRRSVASNHRHNTILLAVALSLVLNRGLSTLLPFRYRPMYHCGRPALEVEIIISFFARGLNQLRFVAQETIGGKAWLCDNASQASRKDVRRRSKRNLRDSAM